MTGFLARLPAKRPTSREDPRPSELVAPGARLIDAATGEQWSGAGLDTAIGAVAAALRPLPPGPVLCLTANDSASVLRYLGVRAADRPAILWDPATPADDLVRRYEPAVVVGLAAPVAGYVGVESEALGPAWVRREPPAVAPHEELALLLATSGSTGRPRLVRHSAFGVRASATAVASALRIEASDVAITSLPLFYTLGLSVLHSHLSAGASVVLASGGVLDAEFWKAIDRYGVTGIVGVPHTFELLHRKPWRPDRHPSVRTLAVSGGRLPDALVTRLQATQAEHGGRLFVMYGQTEAGSRICVLPPERLPEKLGSVGPPVPGMSLSIRPDPEAHDRDHDGAAEATGEVICHSATVMMGYAERVEDLARGDDLRATLATGDHGRLDADGYLWLSGRRSRIGKAYGVRVSLDAVEHVTAALAPAAAVAGDDRIVIWCEATGSERLSEVAALVARELRIHRTAITVGALDRLPRRPNGKVDYGALPS